MFLFLAYRYKSTLAITAVALFFLFFVFCAAYPPRSFLVLEGKVFRNPEPAPLEFDHHTACRHVAVASYVGWHFEIYMSIVSVLEKELCPHPTGSVHVYLPQSFVYGFDSVVDELGLYHGNFSTKDTLFDDLDSTNLYPEDESMIDMIILPSCEWDLKEWHDRLLQSWHTRPADKKFQVVCMFHHGDEIQWSNNLVEWIRTGAIRLLTISEHVKNRLRRNFRALAESNLETYNSAGYEYVKMDVYVPILNLPQRPKNISTSLSDVAIHGSFRFERRDYLGVYADLLASLEEDPRAWGYLPLTTSDPVYKVDETSPLQPFQLHLIGNAGNPRVPPALSNVVRIHSDLSYNDYFSLIHSMDLAIPAWSTLEYYEAKASFTMAISIECNVPILINEWIRESYSFLDDRVIVTRPHAVREIFAVKALRTGQWSPRPAVKNQVKEVKMDVDKMIKKGWIRSADQFAEFKDGVWANNTEVVRRILKDL